MLCQNCKREIDNNLKVCNFCGASQNKKEEGLTKTQKIIILILLSLVVLLLLVLVFTSNKKEELKDGSHTIMIYMVGSNLESDSGIASSDIASINPEEIDLEKIHVLLYTGGTEEWHNFVSNEENAIYILEEDGFNKIETYDKLNMGDPSTLLEFLNYGYDNYNAQYYDLLFYDHGGAIDGAIYDDFSDDNLSLADMEIALKKSPFNEKNKLETVIFRTCLNGTYEVANLFSDYAKYLVASEEVSVGNSLSDVFKFINDISLTDTGVEVGEKFINSYENFIEEKISIFVDIPVTYSLIDLSKIDSLSEELDKYIAGINLKESYNDIARLRNNLYQYGGDTDIYNTIDLYNFIIETSSYSSVSNENVLKILDETIIQNNTNLDESHGLSIYFPYKGTEGYKKYFLEVYEDLDVSENYKKFISQFYNTQSSSTTASFNANSNKIETSDSNEIELELTDEQLKTFNSGSYIIFERDEEHPNFYAPIYSANDVVLDGNILRTNIKNSLIKINTKDGEKYIEAVKRVNGNTSNLTAFAILVNPSEGIIYNQRQSVNLHIVDKDNKLYFDYAISQSTNERINGSIFDINDYEYVELFKFRYKILDDEGNYTTDWVGAPEYVGVAVTPDDYELKFASLNPNEGEYYCIFKIYDINHNVTFSKLIKVGE